MNTNLICRVMEEFNIQTNEELETRVNIMHDESRKLMSELEFILFEVNFFDHLINSYAFAPHTKELFDDFQALEKGLNIIKEKNNEMIALSHKHDNELGGIMDCIDIGCTLSSYVKEHNKFKHEMDSHCEDFKEIKKRVYAYSNIILGGKKNL